MRRARTLERVASFVNCKMWLCGHFAYIIFVKKVFFSWLPEAETEQE